MVAVNVIDGVKYGFRLLGYLLAVGIAGFVFIVIGGAFQPRFGGGGSIVLYFLFILAGVLIWYAGALGMLYKVIADGVEVGLLSAQRGGGAAGGGLTNLGGSGGAGNRQRAQQARQGAQRQQRGGQQRAQQGGQRAQQGGQQPQQGQRGQGQHQGQGGQGQGQQPPQDWEPGN